MASIAGYLSAGKRILGRVPGDLLIIAIIALASSASFGLGFLAGKDVGAKDSFEIEQLPLSGDLPAAAVVAGVGQEEAVETPETPTMTAGGQYVASKNGTKYHLPWCPGAKTINEENKIWFASKEEAEAKGYTPAGNCKGI